MPAASANATPPRSPENHMMNWYVLEIGGSAVVASRAQLVSHEPR